LNDLHDREHLEWLEQLLSGELSPEAPEVRARLEECARCRAELDRLRALGARLDAAGADMRADLEAAGDLRVPGEERIEARVPALAASLPRRRRILPWLLAAAAVLAALLAWRLSTARPGEAPLVLGDEEDASAWELTAESGPGRYARFSWRYRGEPPSGYVLRISDALAPPETPPEEIRCSVPEWIPTEEEERRLPDRIGWQVLALGPSGERDDVLSRSPSVSASR
jgi:hypothetical protein